MFLQGPLLQLWKWLGVLATGQAMVVAAFTGSILLLCKIMRPVPESQAGVYTVFDVLSFLVFDRAAALGPDYSSSSRLRAGSEFVINKNILMEVDKELTEGLNRQTRLFDQAQLSHDKMVPIFLGPESNGVLAKNPLEAVAPFVFVTPEGTIVPAVEPTMFAALDPSMQLKSDGSTKQMWHVKATPVFTKAMYERRLRNGQTSTWPLSGQAEPVHGGLFTTLAEDEVPLKDP